jgi:hypothetical protein
MYTPYLSADATLKANAVSTGTTMTEGLIARTSMIEDWFATTPALLVAPSYLLSDEEELHTSFEQAISDRLIAVNKRLSLISGTLTDSQQIHTRPLHQTYLPANESNESNEANDKPSPRSAAYAPANSPETSWQRSILLGGLALMFLLVGFDIMGLLVLLAH